MPNESGDGWFHDFADVRHLRRARSIPSIGAREYRACRCERQRRHRASCLEYRLLDSVLNQPDYPIADSIPKQDCPRHRQTDSENNYRRRPNGIVA